MEEIIHIYEFLSREEEPLKIFQEPHWTHNILLRVYSWPKIDNQKIALDIFHELLWALYDTNPRACLQTCIFHSQIIPS